MLQQLEEEKPVFLIVTEPKLKLSQLAVDFLQENSFETRLLYLDQDFFLKQEEFFAQKKRIYKIIFLYGFNSLDPEIYQQIFAFFLKLFESQRERIPTILISNLSTSLEIIDNPNQKYVKHLRAKRDFLSNFLKEFANSQVFLAQDLLLDRQNFTYPLPLFFTLFKKGFLIDPQANFFFQDEMSFFSIIQKNLIKPHLPGKHLIRGKTINSKKIVEKIVYFYEQYFQKRLEAFPIITSEKNSIFFQEFSIVKNNKVIIDPILDKRVREINDFSKEIEEISLSEIELKKALQLKNKIQEESLKQKVEKPVKKSLKELKFIEMLKHSSYAQKELVEPVSGVNFGEDFLGKIDQLFSTQRNQEKNIRQEQNVIKGKEILVKSKKRKVLFYLGTLGFSLGLILILLYSFFDFSQQKLQAQLYNLVKNNEKNIEKIDESILYRLFSFQLGQYEKILLEENLTHARDTKNLNETLLNLFVSEDNLNLATYNLYKKSLEGGVELAYFYEQLSNSLDQTIEAQKAFNSYLSALNLDLFQGEENEVWQNALIKNREELKNSLQVKRFLASFKQVLFQEGRVNVLLLFQDSEELRATGGFLNKALILSFEKGILLDKQIFNVDELDDRTYGDKAVDPEISEYLKEKNLFFRDSNWWADFSKSNQESKWFVEQATGLKIDLSIVLNSKILDQFLKELALDNPQSQQKNDLFIEKIFSLKQEEMPALNSFLINGLNQREIFIQSSHQELMQSVRANSWSGEKMEVVCPAEFKQDNCLVDYLYQVENNVGINKINPYIEQNIEHNLGISLEFIRHKRKITFKNLAATDSWPLGSYRSYLKFHLNKQATLEKIEIDGKKVSEELIKVAPSETGQDISVFIEVPKQSQLELSLTYLVPNQNNGSFSYVFLDQKQAGIFSKNTIYNIVFDEQLKPQLIAPQAVYQNRVIRFNNSNQDHFLFAIKFSE